MAFELTADQEKALEDIRRDMESDRPMHRLLMGEVGSGKTVVAAAAALMACEGGWQAALMAPTEVLAEQHYLNLRQTFAELGIKTILVLGSDSTTERAEKAEAIKAGAAGLAIGTHALIQDTLEFSRLGVTVVDEQHRFGVRQRLQLRGKGRDPDVLVLTATPIPRTLALTLYGDLDISTINMRPGGRSIASHVSTEHITEKERERAYSLIRGEVKSGRQAFIVCPLVDDSDRVEAKSVLREAARLKAEVFPDLNVGLLHGRLPSKEKEAVMNDFRSGLLGVLISTTVIEVGVDIPKATVMMIEHAERFGLAQLHQLRGRVGRGEWPSHCLLFADTKTDEARARIEAISAITDGMKLAETDLAIRGEGQIFGARQSGLPDLKLAKLTKHVKVLEAARREALALINEDPKLSTEPYRRLRKELRRRFSGGSDWLMSG